MAQPNPFLLAADNAPTLLPLLRSNPSLAGGQDSHGYSLLHAAASYNHLSLLRALVNEFKVDVNLKDEDDETCLFVTETVSVARCLVEELHVDTTLRNNDGLTAAERIGQDDDFPDIAAYLMAYSDGMLSNGNSLSANGRSSTHPPPLPPNITVDFGTIDQSQNEEFGEPDPEFKRRIEELAAKDDFHGEEGQRALRDLIIDAVRGVGVDERDVRRRVE